jgi:2-haloacid dehalogenase
MSMPVVDTVIFDLGNVLIPFNPRWLFRKMLPDEASIDAFFAETDFEAWNLQMDAGLPFADGVAAHSRKFPHYRPLFEAFFARWQETVGEPIAESIDIFRTLRQRGIRTYALTNFSAETYPLAVARFPFLNDFDGTIVSGIEGLIKPDPAIYQLLMQRHAIEPSRAVFIDDRLENVEAARGLGLRAIHFVEAMALRPALRELGLPTRWTDSQG